jgi:lysophospholipase L1-like esterase
VKAAALMCELHTLKPSVAFVMIGTNDLGTMTPTAFASALSRVVAATISVGTIPVLSTIPSRGSELRDRVAAFNSAIVKLADAQRIPLWDLWRALEQPGVVNEGETRLKVHLSTSPRGAFSFDPDSLRYGMNIRNLQTLEILTAIRSRVYAAGT